VLIVFIVSSVFSYLGRLSWIGIGVSIIAYVSVFMVLKVLDIDLLFREVGGLSVIESMLTSLAQSMPMVVGSTFAILIRAATR
jgi:hypothetical protein